MKSVIFLTILMHAFGFYNFTRYRHMCDGLNYDHPNNNSYCYTLWNNSGLPFNFFAIEKWTQFSPYLLMTNFSIGWAQSHAMAATWQLWSDQYFTGQPFGYTIFSESTFIHQNLNNPSFVNCSSPRTMDPYDNEIIYVPFLFTDTPLPLYDNTVMPFDDSDWQNWCNINKLNNINLNGKPSWGFNGYNNQLSISYKGKSTWGTAFTFSGMGIVGIPHDIGMANLEFYYADGVYRPGNTIYYYPANAVGVWIPANGTVYLLCYCFGASNVATNYLWVDNAITAINDVMTYIADF
jgi:hypothetical protein